MALLQTTQVLQALLVLLGHAETASGQLETGRGTRSQTPFAEEWVSIRALIRAGVRDATKQPKPCARPTVEAMACRF
eukprot:1565238-Alexandrium_andersonii.AAC.1